MRGIKANVTLRMDLGDISAGKLQDGAAAACGGIRLREWSRRGLRLHQRLVKVSCPDSPTPRVRMDKGTLLFVTRISILPKPDWSWMRRKNSPGRPISPPSAELNSSHLAMGEAGNPRQSIGAVGRKIDPVVGNHRQRRIGGRREMPVKLCPSSRPAIAPRRPCRSDP